MEEDATGRRWSLVTEADDLGPRTLWVEGLPPLKEGERVAFRLESVPVLYDPILPSGTLTCRWRPLVEEWGDFLLDEELSTLREPARRGAWGELLGLGPGSTPAGDDYLSGLASGRLWQGLPVPFALDLGQTSWLSGQILRDSMEGKIWRRGKLLLEALALEDGEVPGAAGRIAAWGHSSGRAWLAGLSASLGSFGKRW